MKPKHVTVRVEVLAHARGLDLPAYQTAGSAGLDLAAAIPRDSPIRLMPKHRALVPTGLILELPSGYEAQVRPRSGLAIRHGVTVLNSPGTIDSDYRGEVMVILANLGGEPFAIHRGERIAQLVVQPVVRATITVAAVTTRTKRGKGGFGSTGTATVAKSMSPGATRKGRAAPKRKPMSTRFAATKRPAEAAGRRNRQPRR